MLRAVIDDPGVARMIESTIVIRPPAVLLAVLLLPLVALADTLVGRVVRVIDGDTVSVLDAHQQQERIRLAGIDAPERKQPFGRAAKDYLSTRVAAKNVSVNWHKRDRYGRIVGTLTYGGRDVDLLMVRAGYAWWYRKYASEQSPTDRALYENAESQAKAERRGLWADPHPVPPWEWRKHRTQH
jgi:endonuclease YncB( thermonuclease family)